MHSLGCRIHRNSRKQQHNQLDTTNLILTTMTQPQTDLDDEGDLLDGNNAKMLHKYIIINFCCTYL